MTIEFYSVQRTGQCSKLKLRRGSIVTDEKQIISIDSARTNQIEFEFKKCGWSFLMNKADAKKTFVECMKT